MYAHPPYNLCMGACTSTLHTLVPGYQYSQFAAGHLALHANSLQIKPVHGRKIPGTKADALLRPLQQGASVGYNFARALPP